MRKGYSNFIEVRAGIGSEKNKVFVKGYASIPNKPDLYNHLKLPNGKFRTFKSIFTPKCILDMKKQMEKQPIFVDGMHELAANFGIVGLAKKYNFSSDDLNDVQEALKMKRLPLAKLTEFEIDDEGLIIGTETNPYFALVDEDHKNYYEAVTGSLLDKYLKGYSINFDPTEFVTERDDVGNELTFIDKVNLYGISYTDHPALADNEFTEVCMRAVGSFMKTRSDEKMDEKKEVVQTPDPKPEARVDIEAEVQKRVQASLKEKEVSEKTKKVEEQIESFQKQLDEIKAKRDGQVEPPNKDGVPVQPQKQSIISEQGDKYAQPVNAGLNAGQDYGKMFNDNFEKLIQPYKDWKEEMSRVTDSSLRGFKRSFKEPELQRLYGQLIQLQSDYQMHYRRLDGEGEYEFNSRMAALNKKPDMIVPKG